ncbi:MAG: 1,4-beta-xylanase, partial [Bacteroidia bacterium]|nr:1,4-beta-xylanase [Bacteroidia bacterium]
MLSSIIANGGNPVIKEIGMSDPHVRVFNDTLYLFSGHDTSPGDTTWVMRDWRVFSSTDLINWKLETTISPENNYMGKGSTDCWAGDAASRNGKYYFYFSDRKRSIGVMEANHPGGPYTDALGKPLVEPMHDPTIFMDQDKKKTPYII